MKYTMPNLMKSLEEEKRLESYLDKTYKCDGKTYAVMPRKGKYYDYENECYFHTERVHCDWDYNQYEDRTIETPDKHPYLVDITGLTREQAIEKLRSSQNPADNPTDVVDLLNNIVKGILG